MAPVYSSAQSLSLAGMVIGAILCAVGAIAPYWLVTDLQGSLVLSVFNSFVNANMGIFMYCVELVGESGCHMLPMQTDSSDGWYFMARVAASACVLGSGLTGFIALCLACCHCCDRLICLGILSFLSACAGAMSLILFDKNMNMFTTSIMDYSVASYGWAFYVFCAGVAIMGLVSFTACFSAPESDTGSVGVVVSNQPPPIMVMSHSQMGQTNPYACLETQNHMKAGPNQYPMTTTATAMPGGVNSDGHGYF